MLFYLETILDKKQIEYLEERNEGAYDLQRVNVCVDGFLSSIIPFTA